MPTDMEIKTIQDLIFYQYAKIVVKGAVGGDAMKDAGGFVKQTFQALKNNQQQWKSLLREDAPMNQTEKKCIYCGSEKNLLWEYIVPKTVRINFRCPTCVRVQSLHNRAWACWNCNVAKSLKGLYTYWHEQHPEDPEFYDHIPVLLEEKYLRTIYHCHQCNGTLMAGDLNGDGVLDVFDLDACIKC